MADDTTFLDRLHSDPPDVAPELLPENLRASYRDLLAACADARAAPIDATALKRLRPRAVAARVAVPLWTAAATAAVAAVGVVVVLLRGNGATPQHRAEPSRATPSGPAQSVPAHEPEPVRPPSGADIEAMHVAAAEELSVLLRDGLDRLRRLHPGQIAVLEGDFDRVEAVLDLYGIPYTRVAGAESRRAFWRGARAEREALRRLEGRVTEVQADGSHVTFALGAGQDVRVGDEYEVRRGDEVLGVVRVLQVGEQWSSGGFDGRFTEARPHPGDRVSPRDPDPALDNLLAKTEGRVSRVSEHGATIDLGAIDGACVGATVEFVRDGELLARATVRSVWPSWAYVDLAATAGVRAGDVVRAAGGAWPQRPDPRTRTKVVIAASSRPPPEDERLRDAEDARAFVEGGGWLVTSDRAFHPYVFDAFPNRAETVPRDGLASEVSIRTVPGSALVAGIGDARHDARWGFGENTFVALFPDAGRVLLRADGHDLAFEFRQGRGRVVHVVGHVHLRAGNDAGFVAAHRLLLNVLLARFSN